MMNSAALSELLSSSVPFPAAVWLTLLGIYLANESTRRGLHPLDWFNLPPSMNLIVAVFVGDAGDLIRAIGVLAWRRDGGSGEFSPFVTACFLVSGALVVMSMLCKIRAWTLPDHGHAPWLLTLAGGVLLVAILWGTRYGT